MQLSSRDRSAPPTWLVTVVLVLVSAGALGVLVVRRVPHGANAADVVSRLIVAGYDGRVMGTISPGATATVTVNRDGITRATTTTRAGATGAFSVSTGYDSGHNTGVHNGDVVNVTDGATGRSYSQEVQVSGMLDEVTGALTGSARPGAVLSVKLFDSGAQVNQVGPTMQIRADATGRFAVDWASLARPRARPGYAVPPWRGYQVDITARDVPGQVVWRQIQTANATLVPTRNLAGGGYLLPGDQVTFELRTRGGPLLSAPATADGDGIPQAKLAAEIGDGDVLTMRYHAFDGSPRSLELHPMDLVARADPAKRVVRGTTEPRSPMIVSYFGDGGPEVLTGEADDQGRFAVAVADLRADHLVTVGRVAEDGFTGVGVQQIEMRAPVVHLDDIAGSVTGYGTTGTGPVELIVRRRGQVLVSMEDTTTKDGHFGLVPPREVLPGDIIEVTSHGDRLPDFPVGSEELTGYEVAGGAPPTYAGTATPGRVVTVAVASPSCVARVTVGPDGHWSAGLPCRPGATTEVTVTEVVAGPDDPAEGFTRSHAAAFGAPELRLTRPAVGEVAARHVTLAVASVIPEAADPPSKVTYQVGSVFVDGAGPGFEAAVDLPPGDYVVVAYAFDGHGRHDDQGKPIFTQTRARHVTVG